MPETSASSSVRNGLLMVATLRIEMRSDVLLAPDGRRGEPRRRPVVFDAAVSRSDGLASATAVSDMRFEKPHSLSYQDEDPHEGAVDDLGLVEVEDRRTRVVVEVDRDVGLVGVAENALERAVRAAFLIASLISSLVVARLATNLRSTTETFGVGTRIAEPSSLPLSSGSTRPTALAAPVVVGIIESAAARAR